MRISSTGDGEFTEVHISPDVVDPGRSVEMLEDLVLAALHDVAEQVSGLQTRARRSATTAGSAGWAWVTSAGCWAGPDHMSDYAPAVQELIDALGRLPGIGPKSAQRIAFHLLKADKDEPRRLAQAVVDAADKVSFCELCFNLAEGRCARSAPTLAATSARLCVVEEPRDIVAIERTREYKGRYHVLGGAIDHLQGVGPEQLRIARAVRAVSATSTSPR